MQSVETQFRDKVFDEDVLNFCLVLIEFIEKMPNHSHLLKRVVLDALTVNSSLQEVSVFVKSLNTLPLQDFAPHMGAFLDSCAKMSEAKISLDDFLMTVRHLAERKDFKEWSDFFGVISIVGDKQKSLTDFLMTVRRLAERIDFQGWAGFFAAMNILGAQEDVLSDFLMTVRHLAEQAKFVFWQGFFTCVGVFGNRYLQLSDFLMTARHLVAHPFFCEWDEFYKIIGIFGQSTESLNYALMTIRHLVTQESFKEWSAFFAAIRVLCENPGVTIEEFLVTVRHVINYFKTPDSLKSIFKTMAMVPQYAEACSYGQLDSKQWLISEARKVWGDTWGTVFVLAGWIGFLPRFIFEAGIQVNSVRSFDIDPDCSPAAEHLNQSYVQKEWLFKSSTMDITKMSYPTTFTVFRKDGSACELHEAPDVVINTSCEHIADIDSWWAQIPAGTKVIVQSNDGFHIPEHVRCFKTLAEFEQAMQLSKVDYRGEKALADFNRFMLIGTK